MLKAGSIRNRHGLDFLDASAPEANWPVVKHDELTWCHRALRLIEFHFYAVRADASDGAGLIGLAIARLRSTAQGTPPAQARGSYNFV